MKWIFLPGLDGSGAFFEPFLRVLPEDVEAVPIGFPAGEKWGYEELFDWLLGRLPADEPFLVVAESFSGPLAVRLAAAEPKGMIGAVVCASFVRHPLPRWLRLLPVDAVFRLRLSRPPARFILADADASPELMDLFDEVIAYSPPEVVAHRARAALTVDATDALRTCRLPLLFLQATTDRLIRPRSAELVRRVRPDLRVVPIASPHFLLQMRQQECLRAIQDFLAQL